MTLAAFPAWINQVVLQDGYSETPETNQAVFKPEVGPPKLRRRMSIAQDILTIGQWLSAADWEDLKSFYRSTLKDGTLQFTWLHPRTQTAATFRFEGEPPKVTGIFGITYVVQFTLRLISGGLLPIDLDYTPGSPLQYDTTPGDTIEAS